MKVFGNGVLAIDSRAGRAGPLGRRVLAYRDVAGGSYFGW
jgi:hypothetical protein